MALLTREQILHADDIKKEIVPVPEWGGEIQITTMTGFGRDAWETQISGKGEGKDKNLRAKLVAATAIDAEGELLFQEKDVVELGKKSAAALDRAFEVALRLNKIGPSDVEELAKN